MQITKRISLVHSWRCRETMKTVSSTDVCGDSPQARHTVNFSPLWLTYKWMTISIVHHMDHALFRGSSTTVTHGREEENGWVHTPPAQMDLSEKARIRERHHHSSGWIKVRKWILFIRQYNTIRQTSKPTVPVSTAENKKAPDATLDVVMLRRPVHCDNDPLMGFFVTSLQSWPSTSVLIEDDKIYMVQYPNSSQIKLVHPM